MPASRFKIGVKAEAPSALPHNMPPSLRRQSLRREAKVPTIGEYIRKDSRWYLMGDCLCVDIIRIRIDSL